MTTKSAIEVLTQLAGMGKSDIQDEFSGSIHFANIQANNKAVADALARQLKLKEQEIAEEAATTIIAQLEFADREIERHRRDLGEVRKRERQLVNHIETVAVARVFATETNNYLPLYYANMAKWDLVEIPPEIYARILKQVKAAITQAKAGTPKVAKEGVGMSDPAVIASVAKDNHVSRRERQTRSSSNK